MIYIGNDGFPGQLRLMWTEPVLISIIKINPDVKLEKENVKSKLCINTTLEKSDMYEFKMALFYNGYQGEFLLFQQN